MVRRRLESDGFRRARAFLAVTCALGLAAYGLFSASTRPTDMACGVVLLLAALFAWITSGHYTEASGERRKRISREREELVREVMET